MNLRGGGGDIQGDHHTVLGKDIYELQSFPRCPHPQQAGGVCIWESQEKFKTTKTAIILMT